MRTTIIWLVLVAIGCDREPKRVAAPPPSAHDEMKTIGAPCDDGKPAATTATSPARGSGRAGSFDDRDAQFRRQPCADAGAQ